MAVKIRMQRGGATHNPHYRVVVTDVRSRRDGRFVEKVGVYDPKNKDQSQQYALNLERVDYWLSVGAQPSDTVRSLIKRARRQTSPSEVVVDRKEAAAAPVESGPVAAEVSLPVSEEVVVTDEAIEAGSAVEAEATVESPEAEIEVAQETAVAEEASEEEASEEAGSAEKNA